MREITLASRMRGRDKELYKIMKKGKWLTLSEINTATGYPSASASAGMRDFRKPKYGNNTIDKKYLGNGIYKYRLIKNSNNNIIQEKLG